MSTVVGMDRGADGTHAAKDWDSGEAGDAGAIRRDEEAIAGRRKCAEKAEYEMRVAWR